WPIALTTSTSTSDRRDFLSRVGMGLLQYCSKALSRSVQPYL
ncbi:MAG: hypothetical protein AVDCRST_MAG85-2978, partial [uncultured Solirubrobacteraceae bacterium]